VNEFPNDSDYPSLAETIAFRLGGVRRMPLHGGLDDLYSNILYILTLDQSCDDCASGVHPSLHSGIYGILNSLGWLLMEASDGEVTGGDNDGAFIDKSAVRNAMVASLPAFAHLVFISGSEDLYVQLGECHPEFRHLVDMLDRWLPEGGSFRDNLTGIERTEW